MDITGLRPKILLLRKQSAALNEADAQQADRNTAMDTSLLFHSHAKPQDSLSTASPSQVPAGRNFLRTGWRRVMNKDSFWQTVAEEEHPE